MLLNLFKLQKCCHTDQAHWVLFVKLSLSYKKKSKKKKKKERKRIKEASVEKKKKLSVEKNPFFLISIRHKTVIIR